MTTQESFMAVDVGCNIFEARTRKGWTQKKLAQAIHSHQTCIARLEGGDALPSLRLLLKIANALETSLIIPNFRSNDGTNI